MKLQTKRKIDKYVGYCLIIFLLPAAVILGFLLRRNHSIHRRPSTILFIKLMGLGSLVSSTDAIARMKRIYPDARFILVSDENIIEGIKPFHVFDQYLAIRNRSIVQTVGDSLKVLFITWRIRSLWVVDLEVYSKLTATFSLLTFATNRFGFFLRPVFFRKFLNTHNVFFNQFTNLHDNYLQMATTVTGLAVSNHRSAMRRTDEINMPFVLVNNTCSDLALVRKMDTRQLVGICNWMLENTSYQIAFAGTNADRPANAAIMSELTGSRVINIAGEYDFETYYDFVMKQCAFVISIDSAPLHIALKLGVPTISVWGPTNPSFYLHIPAEEKGRHLYCYQKVACSPCVHHFDKLPCKGDNFCMKNITAETVVSRIRQLLVELDFSQRIEADTPVFV